jgi:hypothetical protein
LGKNRRTSAAEAEFFGALYRSAESAAPPGIFGTPERRALPDQDQSEFKVKEDG